MITEKRKKHIKLLINSKNIIETIHIQTPCRINKKIRIKKIAGFRII
jgi:hypothetical protein